MGSEQDKAVMGSGLFCGRSTGKKLTSFGIWVEVLYLFWQGCINKIPP
jgi:hypothetical protein